MSLVFQFRTGVSEISKIFVKKSLCPKEIIEFCKKTYCPKFGIILEIEAMKIFNYNQFTIYTNILKLRT